jgi:hypothetical protein
MKNKRGLSQVVTTIILILLIILAISAIWVVVDRLIVKGTGSINLDQFTIDLEIVSAKINGSSATAEVKVRRNVGEGNLTGIKFIVEDPRTAEVYEERFARFEELGQKTFNLDLLVPGSELVIPEIEKISIAPIYRVGGQSSDTIGGIADTIEGLETINFTGTGEGTPGGGAGDLYCINDSDCEEHNYLIEGTRTCDDSENVVQYEKTYVCNWGYCEEFDSVLTIIEPCPTEYECLDGQCIEKPIACTNEADCGVDGPVGSKTCQSNPEATVQNYKEYSCVEGFCESVITQIIEECEQGYTCQDGECFEPLECASNEDCNFGEVCELGECIPETMLNNGTIRSVWPYNVGEYMDSHDFPTDSEEFKNYRIVFPESGNTGCFIILDYVTPRFDGELAYVRVDIIPNDITDGEYYEIWETDYGCSFL